MMITLLLVMQTPSYAEEAIGVNGLYVDAAVDNNGDVHLVYSTGDWGDVYYMKYTGGGWIGPTYLPNSTPNWKPFTFPDIAVGSDGIPRVVYGTTSGDPWPNDLNPVLLATANDVNGTSWSVEAVVGTSYRPTNYHLALDENNQPHIAYQLCAKSEPFWWKIMYRRPDGTTIEIASGGENDKVLTPAIAYRDGIVHFAYYRKGGLNTNIQHSWGPPSSPYNVEQISYLGDYNYAETPDISIDPSGTPHFSYLVAVWYEGAEHGFFNGIHCDGQVVDGDWAQVIDSQDFGLTSMTYDSAGNRYLAWSFGVYNETYHKKNSDARVELSPFGHITLANGPGGTYCVRAHGAPGPLYFEQIGTGGPTFYPPTALIDNIDPATVTRGVDTSVSFLGTAFDNDESGASITGWEWTSLWHGVIATVEDFTMAPIDLIAGTHLVRFRALDNESVWSDYDQMTLVVNPDPIPPPAVDDLRVGPGFLGSLIIQWSPVVDNLAMDCYELYRGDEAWFTSDAPVVTLGASDPLTFTDGDAFATGDVAIYSVIAKDVDGNSSESIPRAGGFRFELDAETP